MSGHGVPLSPPSTRSMVRRSQAETSNVSMHASTLPDDLAASVVPLSPATTRSIVKLSQAEPSNISMHNSTSPDDSVDSHSATPAGIESVDDERADNIGTNYSEDLDGVFDDDDDHTSDTEPVQLSTLSLCITKELLDPNVASVALFRGLLNSFPKKISAASDALYWADRDDNGKAAVVKFFGLLDTRGAFGRTKPYFSLDGLRNLDPRNFKKTKAIFEIRPLPMLTEDYPLEARRQSHMFTRGLMMLTEQFEAKRNQNLQKDQIPNVSKMVKENRDEDTYTLVIQTEPLFVEPENDAGSSQEANFTIDDLESDMNHSVFSSPSKTLARKKASMKQQAESGTTRKTVAEMPDPHGLYSKFLARNPTFSSYEIIPPPIYDGNLEIIHPADYTHRLPHLAPVSVEANIRLWEIAPENNRKGARENGSRTYQMMIKKLQLLPYFPKDIQKHPQPLFKGKGKRRATSPSSDLGSDVQGTSSLPSTPTKKPRHANIDNDSDVHMALID